MAYQWAPSDVHTRQHRASTVPPHPQHPIPPSLIPGNKHRQTISGTGTAGGVLYSAPGTVHYPVARFVPVTPDVQRYHPSPYRDVQPPPPPPPVPQPQLVPLQQLQQQRPQQPIVPPLPPKTPFKPSVSPTVPPKPPPPFMHPPTIQLPPKPPPPSMHPPTIQLPPKPSSWPIAQPPPLNVSALPPPPPMPPPKPLGARSRSFAGTPSPFPKSTVLPRASPSLSVKASNNTNHTVLLTVPQSVPQSRETSPVEGSLGMNEEEELKLVLELSARAQREHDDSLLSQDEEYARAVEASLQLSPPTPVRPEPQPSSSVVGSESVPPSPPRKPWDAPSPSPTPLSHGSPQLSVPSPVDDQLEADEAFARRLEAEYENEGTTPVTENKYADMEPGPSKDAQLPLYADVVGKETATQSRESDASSSSPRIPQSSPASVHTNDRLSVPDQANTPPRSTPSPVQGTSPRPESLTIPASSSEAEEEDAFSDTSSPSPQAAVSPNHFVELELLYGVSFGFDAPPMGNLEMRGPLPNIISLPFGKSPPMHIRAPSWRQLLKLMAKLSGTRIEPSVEALAVTKGELQLRTVIQFFRPHHASLDWRTVIYLTIDYPPPADYRGTNGDVNALPYSYSLSTVPAILRDGSDSQLSKFYTVPATTRLALPKLPISMPSMAMYLASALEDSRHALNDSSSGVRRLAKMVGQFYPNQQNLVEAGGEQVRKKGLIKRLIGRQPRKQGGNAEVFELVTPFVPDEWGR